MERPQGLFLVFLFFVGIVTGSAPAHGRIQIRGGHESSPEDVVSFDTECKCNRNEEMSISVSLNCLPKVGCILRIGSMLPRAEFG